MSVKLYKNALSVISGSGMEMDIAHPVTIKEIAECEEGIGFAFPLSYRQFLLEYGFGGVEDVVFQGLISGNLLEDSYVNAYSFTLELRKTHHLPYQLFAIENLEGDAVVCLLMSEMSSEECPVVLWDYSDDQQIQSKNFHILAHSFGHYFYDRVMELVDEAD